MNRSHDCANAFARRGRNQAHETYAMELRFRESALADVRLFVFHYEEAFLELYSDTGLWNESMILESVRNNAKRLLSDIYDVVDKYLGHGTVLGRKTKRVAWYEFSFHVGRRLVIVYYSEDRKHKIRWVESIGIDRKPIIF